MKLVISLFTSFAWLTCIAQQVNIKHDTLFKREKVSFSLDNGFAIPPFMVSGNFYLTADLLIFHPSPSRSKRVEMYNDLVKDIRIPYESIIVAKRRGLLGLKIETETKNYRFDGGKMKLRSTIALINRLRDEHKAKSFRSKL